MWLTAAGQERQQLQGSCCHVAAASPFSLVLLHLKNLLEPSQGFPDVVRLQHACMEVGLGSAAAAGAQGQAWACAPLEL
jgi:hypothetical protein